MQYTPLPQHQQHQQEHYPDHAGLQSINPDHSGLQYVDHGGLEVVTPADHSGGLELMPVQSPHSHPPNPADAKYYWEKGFLGAVPTSYHHQHRTQTGYGSEYSHSHYPASSYEGSRAGGGGGGGGGGDDARPLRDASSARSETYLFGLRKPVFWVLVCIAVFLAVVAVALGAGLGLGLRKSADPTPAPAASTSSSITSSSSTTTGPSRTSYPAPTATATTSPSLAISCPSNNETLIQSRLGSNRKFLVLCGRDYGSDDGAVELFHEAIGTFSDCIDRCAENPGCKAVGWGYYDGNDTCWLKSDIGKPHNAAMWYFAIGEEIVLSASQGRRRSLR